MEQVIGKDGKMLSFVAGGFSSLSIQEARVKVEAALREAGLLEKVEEVAQSLPVAQRGGAIVEQLPMKQWFVRVNKEFALRQDTLSKWKKGERVTLKQLMRFAVESKQTNIVPERFEKTYFHWIDNLRDWCISRQIWFGHRIPVWYCGEEIKIAEASPGVDWTQDPDTLDTWFSSGLWTFSTLGWPDEKTWQENKKFHPTAVLETGYDILFFWVARMILMSTYALGEVPFKDVYLHGLVRDEQGRKMSKSLGNVLDPLDLIPKYGTDAVRLSLVLGTTPGQDVKLSEAKIEGFRNFTNKLWNISRFILMQIGDAPPKTLELGLLDFQSRTIADRAFLGTFAGVSHRVKKYIESYQFSLAGEELRDFTWGYLADWYLEVAKIEKNDKRPLLYSVLKHLLMLWHPFMPFVTEHVWQLAGFEGQLILAQWHVDGARDASPDEAAMSDVELIKKTITDIRRLRAERGVEPAKFIEATVMTDERGQRLVNENIEIVKQLARLSSLSFVATIDGSWATATSGSSTIALNVAATIDKDKEREKLMKQIAEKESYIASQSEKLQNVEFLAKAPPKVVEGMNAKLKDAEAELIVLKQQLEQLC
jgi:valyl-tRNA synthetase